MDLRDGVKVMLPDAWFLLRGSNTEPVLRVVAEAVDEASARALAESVRDQVTAMAGVRKDPRMSCETTLS